MPSLTKPEIRFEEEGHRYFLGDQEIPSLSRILQKVGLTKSYDGVDPWYAERGKAVHKAIELDLAGTLDEDSLDPVISPFLAAWRDFVITTGYVHRECERIYYSETEGFACTIDHLGRIDVDTTLIDVKCTKSHDRGADYQLCGQVFAVSEGEYVPDQMMILELHEDGTYTEFYYPVDLKIMPAIMTLYRRKTRKK